MTSFVDDGNVKLDMKGGMTLNTWFLDGMVAGGGGIIGVLDMDFKFKDEVNATNSVSFSCKSLFVDFSCDEERHLLRTASSIGERERYEIFC